MMRKVPVSRAGREPVVAEEAEAPAVADLRIEQIMLRLDGYYWQAPDGDQEFGPLESLALAQADMEAAGDLAPVPWETLQEAEDGTGIADWIGAEMAAPAQQQSPPRREEV